MIPNAMLGIVARGPIVQPVVGDPVYWKVQEIMQNMVISSDGLTTTFPAGVTNTLPLAQEVVPDFEGKIYCEFEILAMTDYNTAGGFQIGVIRDTVAAPYNNGVYGLSNLPSFAWMKTGYQISNGPGTTTQIGAGDRVMFAIDTANSKVWYGLNGVWENGNPSTDVGGNGLVALGGPTRFVACFIEHGVGYTATSVQIRVTLDTIEYVIPTGFKLLGQP